MSWSYAIAIASGIRRLSFNPQGPRSISTSVCLCKRRSPSSVGVKSWVRAAIRRREHERTMKDTPKSEAQLHAEERLAHETTHVQFLTTNRKGQKLVNYDNQQLAIRPEVFLSKDEQTIICYHPPPKLYPVSYTKPAVGEAWWRPGKENLVKYGGELTSEQIEEVKTLRRENPKLWTITALSNLLEAKPEAIRPHARLSEQQIKELDVERDLYDSLPASKRRLYRQKQTSERVDYVLRTRGSPQAQMFRSREMVAGWRQKIPPA